ncbi:flavin reductase family protein [Paracoccus sp. 1_MG-2023]|uniref:flavin reductase family protein n=1 Tax=unclassified Paracoccus (in: a-proteobacteria) TaxID=2688777 RepID=UPI001C0A57CE|nr:MULTISPECIES: flavin reductase family protein [unclassified Paracoccus (in: a-proteobacteria)]MBU2958311.1 flavin reductase family protein [Paracoccus sp. C2R09]MDO6668438.1 flavin reductase family protein [Paracoccus sp. 1_MG-2023]
MTQTHRSFVPTGDNGRDLRDAFGRFATGVTVVTACGAEGCAAITANSFSSISMEPPLVMWSPAKSSARHDDFAGAEHFAIHVLAADQIDLAMAIAKDRRAMIDAVLEANDDGVPVLDDCLARFDCRRYALHEAGDHTIVLGEVLRATIRSGAPLAFFGGKVARVIDD